VASDDYFRQELHLQMQRAADWGANAVVINARELHSAFGDFLEPKHQPRCCDVMEQEMTDGDVVVSQMPRPNHTVPATASRCAGALGIQLRHRTASVSVAHFLEPSSPVSQPVTSEFMGSVATVTVIT
jgi:hypothetical protein